MLTLEEVRDLALKVQAKFPNNHNPYVAGVCRYTAPGDVHCFVGQMAVEAGDWKVPPFDENDNADGAAEQYQWPIDDKGRQFLVQLQNDADTSDGDDITTVRTWPRWGDLAINDIYDEVVL